MGAGVTSVNQRISHGELNSAIGAGLRIGPGLSVAIPWPHVDLGKLKPEVLELRTLLHRLLIEQLQVFDV